MADTNPEKSSIIQHGQKAEKFLEESRYWFSALREALKESIARNFENPGEGTKKAIARYGAQLSVLADLEQQLETLAAEGEIAARE